MTTLRVNSIESFSTKDGDGVRSVVFLQGCPLRCVYCHNVETRSSEGGEDVSVQELTKRVLRFKPYFCERGGVTVSGGEPLIQAANLIPFFQELKKHEINIALDTSGCLFNTDVKKVISFVDHVILDFKFASEEDYKKYANGKLETTLKFLDECIAQNKRIWIRIVVVPGINDTEESLDKYLTMLKGRAVERIELLPFHTLGFGKFEKLGIENPLKSTKALSATRCGELQDYVNKVAFGNKE